MEFIELNRICYSIYFFFGFMFWRLMYVMFFVDKLKIIEKIFLLENY